MSKAQRIYVYLMALIAGLALLASALLLSRWAVTQAVAGRLFPLGPAALGRPPLMPWLWVGLAALVVWAIHWLLARRAAVRPEERGAPVRKAYLYLMQMAALFVCLYEGGLLAADLIARFLQRPAGLLLPWPAGLLAAAAGLLIGFLTWAFHRRVVLRDGDFGRETRGAARWRRLYFYAATATGVLLMATGAVQFLGAALALWTDLAAGDVPAAAAWRGEVVIGLTNLALGIPLAILAWHGANQPVQVAPEVEVNAPGRLLFLRAGAFLGASATLAALFFALRQLFLVTFGRRLGQTETLWTDPLILALAVAPVAVAAWLAFANALQNDVALGGEGETAARLRRVQFYIIAGAALAGLWYGLAHLLRVILPLALDAFSSTLNVGLPVTAERLSLAAALVLVGAPAWWGHWWPQQVRARAFTPEGFAERASAMRKLYYYAVIAAASGLVLVSLGLTIFTLFGGRLTGVGQRGTVVLMTGALATGLVALAWWLVHVLSLRADRQSQFAWMRIQLLQNRSEGEATAPLFGGPRTIPRAVLAPLAVAAAIDPPPARPIAVVDGGDGAMGAALVKALRAALPQATIWPAGLTPAAQAAMAQALGQPGLAAPTPKALARAAVVIGASDALAAPASGAAALADGQARILLLPPRDPRLRWVAAPDWPIERWIENAVAEAVQALQTGA